MSSLLYHELQTMSLCGVHCLNSLLQGPYFTSRDLHELADSLDQQEKAVLATSIVSVNGDLHSENATADGNFSIQVLSLALQIYDLSCINIDSLEATSARDNPQEEKGFICHLQNHWFSLRKVNGEWYDFNSLLPAPEHLSQFFLNAYISTLKVSGWTIFIVRGNFPIVPPDVPQNSDGHGKWWTVEEAAHKIAESREITSQSSQKLPSDVGRVLGGEGQSGAFVPTNLRPKPEKFDWSNAGTAHSLRSSSNTENPKFQEIPTSQPESMALERQEEELEDSNSIPETQIKIAIRLPDGKRVLGNFKSSSTVKQVLDFLSSKGILVSGYSLCLAHPGALTIQKFTSSLSSAGVSDKSTLILKKL